MTSVKARVQAMDNFQVVRYFEAFGQHLLAGLNTSFEEIKDGVPASVRAVDGWQRVETLTPEQAEQLLAPVEAAATARNVLLRLADDATFGPLLEEHLASYRDDELVVEIVLAVGLVASVLMVIASTKVEWKDGKLKIEHNEVDLAKVTALIESFARVLPTS